MVSSKKQTNYNTGGYMTKIDIGLTEGSEVVLDTVNGHCVALVKEYGVVYLRIYAPETKMTLLGNKYNPWTDIKIKEIK